MPKRNVATAAVLVAVLWVAGCSSAPSFQSQVQERAASGEAFELPSQVEGSQWEELLVLCPYASPPASVDGALAQAAATIDTGATDSSQWLLFRTGDTVTTVTLERTSIDFCSDASHGGATYQPNVRWVSVRDNHVEQLSPEVP